MKNQIKQIFHYPKFVIGFVIFLVIFLITLLYPLFVTEDPLKMLGKGNFFKPGVYIAVSDVVRTDTYPLNLDPTTNRLEQNLLMTKE